MRKYYPDAQTDDRRQRQADEGDLHSVRTGKFNQELTTAGIFARTFECLVGFYHYLFAGIGPGTIAKLDTLVLRHIERVSDSYLSIVLVIWTASEASCVP